VAGVRYFISPLDKLADVNPQYYVVRVRKTD
jgi:hypothetical protein